MRLVALLVAGVMLSTPSAVHAAGGSRQAADAFGRALTSANLEPLRSVLPKEGKVRLKLVRLGPEDGWFGPAQVEAIFGAFLAEGSVERFEILRVEGDDRSTSLVHGRAAVTDRTGRVSRVRLHMSFASEADRWVLREIKELRE